MTRPRVPVALVGAIAIVASLLVAACGGGAASPSSGGPTPTPGGTASIEPSTGPSADPTPTPVALTVGLGYIPSVQFAPFYLADQAGYYAEAGLDVEFQNKIDPDLITLVGQGSIDIGLADGTSVIPAVGQGIPIRYVATIYGKFPSIVFAKASSGIAGPADLAGRRLGIPGRYGSSWIMLQALLASVELAPDDLEIVEYPDFGQGAAVIAGAVDAATGFANNEPVQLELTGEPASVLRIDGIVPLPGNGLIVGESTLAAKRASLEAFVGATLRAMEEIAADPDRGLDAAIAAMPELASNRDGQAAILAATIDVWTGAVQAERGLGAIEPTDWLASAKFLYSLGLTSETVVPERMLDTTLLPTGD